MSIRDPGTWLASGKATGNRVQLSMMGINAGYDNKQLDGRIFDPDDHKFNTRSYYLRYYDA